MQALKHGNQLLATLMPTRCRATSLLYSAHAIIAACSLPDLQCMEIHTLHKVQHSFTPLLPQANGYGNIGRTSSAGTQQNQAPPAHPTPTPPQPPVSAFQQANGHTSSAHTSQDLGAGQTSGDLVRTPSPAGSQVRLGDASEQTTTKIGTTSDST